jgi:hypothetical protein
MFMNTRQKLKLHAHTLSKVIARGTQTDPRGAAQVLGRCSQAVARGSFLSQALDRDAEAAARGAVP